MSPLAKFFRTFAAGMTGTLAGAVIAAQAGDYHAGLVALTVGVVAALLAGGISAALAAADTLQAGSPASKALATFLQYVAAAAASIGVATLTDVTDLPRLLLPALVAGALAAVQTFAQNAAEAKTA